MQGDLFITLVLCAGAYHSPLLYKSVKISWRGKKFIWSTKKCTLRTQRDSKFTWNSWLNPKTTFLLSLLQDDLIAQSWMGFILQKYCHLTMRTRKFSNVNYDFWGIMTIQELSRKWERYENHQTKLWYNRFGQNILVWEMVLEKEHTPLFIIWKSFRVPSRDKQHFQCKTHKIF